MELLNAVAIFQDETTIFFLNNFRFDFEATTVLLSSENHLSE